MKPKHQRMWLLVISAIMVCGGAALILYNFSNHLIYFYTPTQMKAATLQPGQTIRLGGLVENGSIAKNGEQSIHFVITDLTNTTGIDYTGSLPSLFREGQGVIAEGALNADGTFQAKSILAKHDENYMPPEVVKALKASGRWQEYSKENIKAFKP